MAGPSFGDCHGWARIIGHIPLLMPSRYWSLTARRILSLFTADFDAVNQAIAGMQQDAARPAPAEDVHALLRYELCALLLRLTILQDQHMGH